jgi:hypothetical protein
MDAPEETTITPYVPASLAAGIWSLGWGAAGLAAVLLARQDHAPQLAGFALSAALFPAILLAVILVRRRSFGGFPPAPEGAAIGSRPRAPREPRAYVVPAVLMALGVAIGFAGFAGIYVGGGLLRLGVAAYFFRWERASGRTIFVPLRQTGRRASFYATRPLND